MPTLKKLHRGTVKDGVRKGAKWFKFGGKFITEAKYNAIKARRAAAGKGPAKSRKAVASKKSKKAKRSKK